MVKNTIDIEAPFMIVGVSRSGTTLLQAILNAHSQICSPPESHFIHNYIAKEKINRILRKKGSNGLIKELNSDKDLQRLGIEAEEVIEEIKKSNNEISCENVFKQYLTKYITQKEDKSIVAEKDPLNIIYLNVIKEIFSHAHIVHIIRDPRDVVLSLNKVDFSSDFTTLNALKYKNRLMKGKKSGEMLFGENYTEVYYEDLLIKPEKTVKNLCDDLHIPFEKQMLEYYSESDDIVMDEEKEWKKNVNKPINNKNFEKWKDQLTDPEIYIIEKICKKCFKVLPYTPSDKKEQLNTLNKIKCDISIFIFSLFFNLKQLLKRVLKK